MNELAYTHACSMLAMLEETLFLTAAAKERVAQVFAGTFVDYDLGKMPEEAMGQPIDEIIHATLVSSWNSFTAGFHIAAELIHESKGGSPREALH